DYPVTVFCSREGYFKKITPLSLRMSGEQKYKEGDGPSVRFESTNRGELLVFTDRQNAYKARLSDFEDTKASVLGAYLPTVLGMEEGEQVLAVISPEDYKKHLLFFFANGKAARLPMDAYETKTNRRRLVNAYSDKSPLVSVLVIDDEQPIACFSSEGRALVFNTALLALKSSRTTQGVNVMTLKKKFTLTGARPLAETNIQNTARYSMRSIPAAGALLKDEDRGEKQMSLIEE
ncbi:MAG: DNA gyrase C-terminal beta-propeller domain-containing protein, partial [Eubacteriales bacterium]|nr:DNA gyrase C-terminal beta-propeller domain-containing protein [Eubacteriales bacterium]